ncbi:hypothetical protein ACHAXS_010851 [Conticribra weissflogii]
MNPFHDEDDLFGANLSMEFATHHDGTSFRRPWQSQDTRQPDQHKQPKQPQKHSRHREPYELLDDVPPASMPSYSFSPASPSRMNNASLARKPRDPFELLDEVPPAETLPKSMFPDGLLPEESGFGSDVGSDNINHRREYRGHPPGSLRYPVDELYPDDNVEGYQYDDDDDGASGYFHDQYGRSEMKIEDEDSRYFDDYSHYNYSQAGYSSRYPIDDAEEDVGSYYSKESGYDDRHPYHREGPRVQVPVQDVSRRGGGQQSGRIRDDGYHSVPIVESRSDVSEISEYRPMHSGGRSANDDYEGHHAQTDGAHSDDGAGDYYQSTPRRHDNRVFQNDSDSFIDCKYSSENEGDKSQSSFDRLYADEENEHDETLGILENITPRSPDFQVTNNLPSSREMNASEDRVINAETTPEVIPVITPSSYNSTPISEEITPSTKEEVTPTDEEWKRWENMNHPVDAPTPQRSNVRRNIRPGSPHYKKIDYAVEQEHDDSHDDVFRIQKEQGQDDQSSSTGIPPFHQTIAQGNTEKMAFSSSEGGKSPIQQTSRNQDPSRMPGSFTSQVDVDPHPLASLIKATPKRAKLEPNEIEPREPEGLRYGREVYGISESDGSLDCHHKHYHPQQEQQEQQKRPLFPDVDWDSGKTGNMSPSTARSQRSQQIHRQHATPVAPSQGVLHSIASTHDEESQDISLNSYHDDETPEITSDSNYHRMENQSPNHDPDGTHYFAQRDGAMDEATEEFEPGPDHILGSEDDHGESIQARISSDSDESDTTPKARRGRTFDHQPRNNQNRLIQTRHAEVAEDEDTEEDSTRDEESSLNQSDDGGTNSRDGDSVSVISDDSALGPQKNKQGSSKKAQPKRYHPYSIKKKDSIEDDMKIDYEESEVKDKNLHPYDDIKRKDSMEIDIMNFDIDGDSHKREDQNQKKSPYKIVTESLASKGGGNKRADGREEFYGRDTSDTVISPPDLRRNPMEFTSKDEVFEFNEAQEALEDEMVIELTSDVSSSDDESEGSSDPTTFPSKALSRMNLGIDNNKQKVYESDVEKACDFIARGRNEEALKTLSSALKRARSDTNHAKQMLDNHYFQKERSYESKKSKQRKTRFEDDEIEDELKANLQDSASELADIINNIGVVHEINFNFQGALASFHEALDVYRNICHRYENSGDSAVDRTVSNIMQLSIALRSQNKRRELHQEADELGTEILSIGDIHVRTQLRLEQLNILMCVLDVEIESLGRTHPAVGYTLMKKGKLHLEMMHIDMAIKDIREAIAILRMGLGPIHPDVGIALKSLADIFNYNCPGNKRDDKNTALALYEEALKPFRESYGNVHSDLGLTYNSIGIIHCINGDTKLAIEAFYKALAGYGVRSKGDEEAKGRSRPDVFFVWLNVGDLHMEGTEWQLALRSYQKAHSAFKSLGDKEKSFLKKIGPKMLMRPAMPFSKSVSFDDNESLLASVLQNIGKAQSILHQHGKAIETLEEALRIHQVIEMRGNGLGVGMSRDVARLLENLGEVHMACGNLTSAKEHYVKSLNILRSNNTVHNSGIEVALVLGAIGRVHLKQGEYSEAKVVLKECMRTFEKLGVPPNNRKTNEIRSSLVDAELALMQKTSTTLASQRREISGVDYKERALACDELADTYRNSGDLSSAIWFYSEALNIRREKAVKLSGARRDAEIVDVGRTLSNIAHLRRQRREFEACKILLEEAKKLYTDIGLSPNHPFYKDLIQDMETMRKA